MKLAAGIVVTALALFVFGFLFWGANPLPYASWNETPDAAAAEAAVQAQFPQTGVYSVPNAGEVPGGVWAMLYVRHDPPQSVPAIGEMLKGLAHYLLVAGALALVLRRRAALGETVRRAAVLGVAAVVVVEGSDVAWWGYPLAWKLWGAAYHVLVFTLGALVLAWFLPERAGGEADAAA